MSNELTILRNGAAPSTAFKGVDLPKSKLGDGIDSGGWPWCRIAYKGKDWSIRDGAKDVPLKTRDLNVVILKAANHPSRRWFSTPWKEGDPPRAPDCYSTGGFTPDLSAPNRQEGKDKGCLNCKWNAWASKEGSRGKACHEFKTLAVVPAGDIENKSLRGPMSLAVPPNSLKALKNYEANLEAISVHYAQVVTTISFAPGLFEFGFDATAFLDDVQAKQAISMLKHPFVDRILDEEVTVSAGDTDSATGGDDVGPIQKLKAVEVEPETKPAAPAKVAETPAVQPQPVQETPAPAPTLQEQEIARLRAELAAATAAGQAQEAAKPKGKGGRPRGSTNRTPQVSPTNMDSEKLAGPPLPAPVGPQEVANDELPVTGNDPAMSKLNDTLNRAKDLI